MFVCILHTEPTSIANSQEGAEHWNISESKGRPVSASWNINALQKKANEVDQQKS